MMTVRNLQYCESWLVNYNLSFLLFSATIFGFSLRIYTVAENAESVNVTVEVLNGTLARDVHVLLMTVLTDSTARGISC